MAGLVATVVTILACSAMAEDGYVLKKYPSWLEAYENVSPDTMDLDLFLVQKIEVLQQLRHHIYTNLHLTRDNDKLLRDRLACMGCPVY